MDKLTLIEFLNITLAILGIILALFSMGWGFHVQKTNDNVSKQTIISLSKIEERSNSTQTNIQQIVNKTNENLFSLLKNGGINSRNSGIISALDADVLLEERSANVHKFLVKALSIDPQFISDPNELNGLLHTNTLTSEHFNHIIDLIGLGSR